jgi:UDP-glucose 4-epimerase
MKILVTGGAGFIGSNLIRKLVERGEKVISLDNYSTGKYENLDGVDCEQIAGDVTRVTDVHSAMKGCEVVFHLAASKKTVCQKSPWRDMEVNAGGALIVAQAARELGVKKVVHASTGSVYGEVAGWISESTATRPVSYYGVSKLAGERYMDMYWTQFGLDVTILRYFHVYGPWQDSSHIGGVVAIFIDNLLHGRKSTVYWDGYQTRSFTYVEDVVWANIAALEQTGGVFNVASAERIPVSYVIEKAAMMIGVEPNYRTTGLRIEGDIHDFNITNDRIKGIGIKFTKFDEGLAKTIEWYGSR